MNNESRSYEWITSTISSKLCGDVDGQLGTTGLGQFAERQYAETQLAEREGQFAEFFSTNCSFEFAKF